MDAIPPLLLPIFGPFIHKGISPSPFSLVNAEVVNQPVDLSRIQISHCNGPVLRNTN